MVITGSYDNGSYPNRVDTVTHQAKADNVAAHTVAACNSVREFVLKCRALETGVTYTKVPDMTQMVRLRSVFDAIRTNQHCL